MRVECGVFPDDREQIATILGHRRRRLLKSEEGMWDGHLAVAIGDEWLLDATIDQANKPHWGPDVGMDPVALALPAGFFKPSGRVLAWADGRQCRARYCIFPRQTGFARAPAARPSHWGPLAEEIMAEYALA